MNHTIHTDLAIEAAALTAANINGDELKGVISTSHTSDNITITEVQITNQEGAAAIGKPIGRYVTLEVPDIRDNIKSVYKNAKHALTAELQKFIKSKKPSTILVVGLGNRFVTPDALGPKVVDKLLVTRHLGDVLPKGIADNLNPLCAIAPGVLGITGIESLEIIKGVTDKVKPDVIIAIDALASRKTSRISTTFQLCDTGITPGSGIGNKRQAISRDTLGVPVIAIGVPTVIEAVAVANDAIDMLIDAIRSNTEPDSKLYEYANAFDNDGRYKLIDELLTPSGTELIVTPKEVDSIIDEVSAIIADSINTVAGGDAAEEMRKII